MSQAPLQNRAPDWSLGSNGCYDEASLQQLQQQLAADLGSIADGNASGCLSLPVPDSILAGNAVGGWRGGVSLRAMGTVQVCHGEGRFK